MGDRGAERTGRSPLRVDVDPLLVARRVGKQVDLLLGHREPLAGAELLSDECREGIELVEHAGHTEPPTR
jgi:hypothetical protein